jgi:hypothetical protein
MKKMPWLKILRQSYFNRNVMVQYMIAVSSKIVIITSSVDMRKIE